MSQETQQSAGRRAENGILQMAGGLALFETGLYVPNLIWGVGTVICGAILGSYGLKDLLTAGRRQD